MNPESLRILAVEDDVGDVILLEEALRHCREAEPVEIHPVVTLADALDAFASREFDVVLLDLHLPDTDGGLDSLLSLLERVRLPIIVMTGLDDEELALEALHVGAQDYLVKGRIDGDRTWRSIRYARERFALLTRLERSHRQEIQLRDELLSHVSHELKTPLAVVHEFLSLLRDGHGGELNPRQTEFVDICRRNSDQLKRMISDLLEAARGGAGKLTLRRRNVRLEDLVCETALDLEPGARSKGLDYRVRIEEGLPDVDADPDRVRQILINLIENAIKFTAPPGTVEIGAGPGEAGFLRIWVRDTGCGIGEEGRQRVFLRLHQETAAVPTSRNGLGLGLHLCQQLVLAHGGRIWVESEESVGSVFIFSLPVATPQTSNSTPYSRS